MSTHVWGFFYGGLINPRVMDRLGMTPRHQELAMLPGFDLRIAPLVNLVRSPRDVVFGMLMRLTHEQLQNVYGQLKAVYLPEAVLAVDAEGRARPALCYIVPDMEPGQADADHVNPLLESAQALGFPEWYVSKIRSYLPADVG